MPQESMERCVVPIPKQITSAFRGFASKASGKCAIIFVIGVRADLAIKRMRTGLPVRFETAAGDVRIEGALVDCDENGRATACESVRVSVG